MKRQLLKLLPVLPLPMAAVPVLSAPADLVAVVSGTREAPAVSPVIAADPRVIPPEVDKVPIVLLVDLSSGQTLYAKEPDRRFVPASITKVMTLYTAFELLKHGHITPQQNLRMSVSSFKKWNRVGSTMFLDPAMAPTVNDLLLGIANVSANDACIVLAEGAAGTVPNWIALMNGEARQLGMKDSHFATPNGWMDEGETYVTAHDLATLAEAMIAGHPEAYRRYVGHETLTWNGITQHNHDPILGRIKGADGIKTGFTNQSGFGFLGSAERGGRRLVMVVAGAGRARDRDAAARALIYWGFAAFSSKPVFAAGQQVGEARVQGGAARHVGLVTPSGFSASIPGDTQEQITMRIVYDGPLEAPVEKGSIVAALEISIGKGAPHRVPLVAAASVVRGGWLARLRDGLFGIVT